MDKKLQTTKKDFSVETLIGQAIEKNVSVETMEKLLAMRKELKAEFAKEEFDRAMADFQEECPVIKKNTSVKEKDGRGVRYKYATLDSIVEQVKEYIAKNGLSYSLNVKQDDKMLTVVCTVKHEAGHGEQSEFSVPIGNEAYMSEVQKYGARVTFAKRYAFCNAFGIMTGDEDVDANIEEEKKPTPPKNNEPMSDKQFEYMMKLVEQLGKDEAWIEKQAGVKLAKLNKFQATGIIDQLVKLKENKQPEAKEDIPTVCNECSQAVDDKDWSKAEDMCIQCANKLKKTNGK